MEDNKELVTDVTENVDEQATEELVEGATAAEPEKAEESVKTYTEEELNAKVDELLAKKIARKEAKIRREYEEKYSDYLEAESVLNAGLGTSNIKEATDNLRNFYKDKGIEVPTYQPKYNEFDMEAGAEKEANSIIDLGYDEIVSEVDRLANIGYENMTDRDKIIFTKLAEERKRVESEKEMNSLGITKEDIEKEEFKNFASKLDPNMTLKEKYEFYQSVKPKESINQMGSMKSTKPNTIKDHYTDEEIAKLSLDDLDDDAVWNAVRNSMTGKN